MATPAMYQQQQYHQQQYHQQSHYQQQAPPQQQQQQQMIPQQQQQQQPVAETGGDGSEQKPIYVDTKHDDMIHDAQMDYYGCKLATCSSDRTIKIFQVTSQGYTPTTTLPTTHTGPIWSLSWSHPQYGSLLASSSFSGSVEIHRENAPNQWIPLSSHPQLHDSSVNAVRFGPHEYGLVLGCAGSDGIVSVLTHGAGDQWAIEKFRDNGLGVNGLSWGPWEEEAGFVKMVTGGCDNGVRFWRKSVSGGEATWEPDPEGDLGGTARHKDWVRDVAWCPSLAGGESIVASASEDGTVIIWKKKSGESVWMGDLLNDFGQPVWRVSWSVTGSVLAVSSGEGDITLWKQTMDGGFQKVSTVEENGASEGASQH